MELQAEKKKLNFSLFNYLLIIICLSFTFIFQKYIPSSLEILFDKENHRVKYFEKYFFSSKNDNDILDNKKIINVSKISYKNI
jgi:hypothetical protein